MPTAHGFARLLALHPELLDRRLLDVYYDPSTLADPSAAAVFVAPDRRPLPDAPAWLLAG